MSVADSLEATDGQSALTLRVCGGGGGGRLALLAVEARGGSD